MAAKYDIILIDTDFLNVTNQLYTALQHGDLLLIMDFDVIDTGNNQIYINQLNCSGKANYGILHRIKLIN